LALIPVAALADTTVQVAPVMPPAFRLLGEPAVVKELGLNGKQQSDLDKLRQSAERSTRDVNLGRFGVVPAEALRDGFTRQINEFLANSLTKEQRARLDQIAFQLREREFGPHQAFAMSARDLRLRPDQLEDVRNLKGLRVEEIAKSVTGGKRYEKVKADVSATNGETFEKMAEMLTRTQRERLKELRGKAFEMVVGEAMAVKPDGPKPAAKYPAPTPGLYDLELKYLDTSEFARELKLTDTQAGNVARARRDIDLERPLGKVPAGKEQEIHDYTAKVLADILTPAQRDRFDELMMQRRARVSPEAVCSYPAAISALKLTPVQLQQLSSGKHLADVLSKDQATKYERMLAEPSDMPWLIDEYIPATPFGRAPLARTVVPPAIAQDFLKLASRLQLSEKQFNKLRELAEDEPKVRELIQKELSLEDAPPVAGASRCLTAVNAVNELYLEAVEKQCWDVLDPQQQSTAKKIFGRGRK
jgi:hypothetical protein